MLGVRAGPSYGVPQKGSVRLTIFVSALAAAAWIWLLLFSQPRCWESSKDRLLGPPSVSMPSSDPSFASTLLDSQLAVLSPSNHALVARSRSTSSTGRVMESEGSTLRNIVFGIGASAELWQQRKEYVKLWWRPGELRGYVWLDEPVEMTSDDVGQLPELRVSEDISRFRYTNPKGHPSAIRLSRIVSETVRMQPQGVDWFVMGDDDTIFSPDNLVKVLSKYDHTKMVYIGSSSESHRQNVDFSYQMAFGGGGFALSYPLARALERMQDKCLERHPELFGSDDRMQACVAELGVPLFKEAGFHQVSTLFVPSASFFMSLPLQRCFVFLLYIFPGFVAFGLKVLLKTRCLVSCMDLSQCLYLKFSSLLHSFKEQVPAMPIRSAHVGVTILQSRCLSNRLTESCTVCSTVIASCQP